MGIVRLLTILFIAWLVYALYKRYLKNKNEQIKTPPPKKAEEVVKCEKCAVHIPRQEAIELKGRYYCSKAHLPIDK